MKMIIQQYGICHTIKPDPIFMVRVTNNYVSKTTVELNCPDSVQSFKEYWDSLSDFLHRFVENFIDEYICDNFREIRIPTMTLRHIKQRGYKLVVKYFTLKVALFCWYYKKPIVYVTKEVTESYSVRDAIRAEVVKVLSRS